MFVAIGPDYAALCDHEGQEAEAARARGEIAKMEKTVLTHGWDGDWFLRAYDFFGNKVGSKDSGPGRARSSSSRRGSA